MTSSEAIRNAFETMSQAAMAYNAPPTKRDVQRTRAYAWLAQVERARRRLAGELPPLNTDFAVYYWIYQQVGDYTLRSSMRGKFHEINPLMRDIVAREVRKWRRVK